MKASIKKSLLAVAATAAAATVAVAVPASSAHAIDRVDCSTGDGFVQIYQGEGAPDLCFTGAGALDVEIYGVDRIYTGNHAVTITWQEAIGYSDRVTTRPEQSYFQIGATIHKIKKIEIR